MKRLMLLCVVFGLIFVQPAFARVLTLNQTDGYPEGIYIAGDTDNYPLEYYNEDEKAFSGIIPDLLDSISQRLDIPFVYINGTGRDKNHLGENMQVDIVSSMSKNTSYGKQYLELISYEENGKTVHMGIVFTDIADDSMISAITAAAGTVTQEEKNGICVSYASGSTKNNYVLAIVLFALLIMIVVLALYLIRYIKKIKRGFEYDKTTDPETGMGNLQFFKYHFSNTLDDVSRSLYHLAYIILDSSYLRSYYGESSFEDVLRYTADVLSEHTGDREISARISESGFVFAFQATNVEDGRKRLCEVMDKLNAFEDVRIQGGKLVFHAAVYPLSGADRNCEILLFNLRKNCNRIFGTEKQIIYCDKHSMNLVQEEKKITESILNGFEKNEFKVYLQFIVETKTGKIVSAEALSRWDNREKGLISPDKYIENMEKAGLIGRHDFYMFENVCRQLEKWRDTELGSVSISCNFTRITLSEDNFINRLAMICDSYNFDRSRLSIEITEDAMEKDTEIATENVRKCKEMGFKVYLDDLGSGYTSLANLCDYPIDVVKVDRNILLKSDTPRGKDLLSGIIALAHNLNIKVICEGVETSEQNILIQNTDCDYIQGWYYAKPLPTEECEAFVRAYNNRN